MKTLALGAICLSLVTGGARAHANDKLEILAPSTGELALQAFWEPVTYWSSGERTPDVIGKNKTLLGVAPAEEWHSYSAEEFSAFLPDGEVAVGEVWSLELEAARPFLSQFHPGVQFKLHREPSAKGGSYACLRAISANRVEILIRVHAQLKLEGGLQEGGIHFTPSQFEGVLTLDRNTGEALAFSIGVPDRVTNLDVNVSGQAPENVAKPELKLPEGFAPAKGPAPGIFYADIGYIPRMELLSEDLDDLSVEQWSDSIRVDDARKRLHDCFYAPIDWMSFEAAVYSAREQEKPLHVVVIFGCLDDESC